MVPILELFNIATNFFSFEENVSLSAVFPILHGILDQLATTEHSELSQSTAIKQFRETVSSNIVERFNLKELHNAHPMLLTAILDPRFKSLTISRYTDREQLQLKQSVIELMEMYKEFEEDLCSTVPAESMAKRPKKLTALDRLDHDIRANSKC